MSVSLAAQADYPGQFRSHIARATQALLAAMQAQDTSLPGQLRDQSLHILRYALYVPGSWPLAGELLVLLAPRMEQAGHRDDWMPFLVRGIELGMNAGDLAIAGELYLQLGVLHQLRGRYDDARDCLEDCLDVFRRIGDRLGQARALNRLASVARLQRQFVDAHSLLDDASTLLFPDDSEGAYALFVRGNLASDEMLWREAADYFEQALEQWTSWQNPRMMAWSLTNLGASWRRLERFAKAIECYTQAIAIYDVIHDPAHSANARVNLGNVCLNQERFSEALEQYLAAENAFARTQDRLGLAVVANNKGIVFRHLGNWSAAEEAYLASVSYWRDLDNPKDLANALDGLGLTYQAQGRVDEALNAYREALAKLAAILDQPGVAGLCRTIETHLKQFLIETRSL